MAAETDEAAAGNKKLQVDPAASLIDQVDHASFSHRKFFRHNADERFGDIDKNALHRL